MEYNGKKALVCGMARSGIAAAKLLNRLGARVTLQDMKKREEISADVLALEGEGIVLYMGANPDEIACAQDMFETIFKDYPQEKDVHISGLLADFMNQKPVTAAGFAALAGKILLILPDQDFFSAKMQEDLIGLMHHPQILYVSGGHLSTVLNPDGYIRAIRSFLFSDDFQ